MKVLIYMQFDSELCSNCATREEDWLDEEGRILDNLKYAPVTRKCFGCAEIENLRDNIPSDQKGVYVVLERGASPDELFIRAQEMKNMQLYGTIDPDGEFL